MKEWRLVDVAPNLCAELRSGLTAASHPELAAQIDDLLLQSWHWNETDGVVTASVRGGRQLNVVEKRIIGEKHGHSISLEASQGLLTIDVDNFNRIRGIEGIGRSDIADEFRAHGL